MTARGAPAAAALPRNMSKISLMARTSPLLAWILSASLALGALGCNGAFKDAMESGNYFAESGRWDEAAASYERAVRLDPDDLDARKRLQQARAKRVEIRVAASRAHLARGELALAVQTAYAAYAINPQSPEARATYTEARARAFTEAERLLAEDKAHEALKLARALYKANPNDRPAVDLEGRCLDAIASRAYDRAVAYIEQKKLGNALLALREAQHARPGYRDAAARERAARLELEDELRITLVIERASDADRTPLATRVEARLLNWKPEKRYRLTAAASSDPPPGFKAVRIHPKLGPITRDHSVETVPRSCDYTCGVDRVPNPAYEVASRRAAEGERRMQAAEAGVLRARRAENRARKEVTDAAAAAQTASAEESRARADRDACSANKKPDQSCQAEEDRYEAARRASEVAAKRSADADDARARAESDAREAENEKESARSDWNRALADLGSTPATVLVDRICTHNYGVEVHTFSGAVTLTIGTQLVGAPASPDQPPTLLTTRAVDEAFPAVSGRCAQVAAGDPLTPPSDADVEAALAERVVGSIQDRVATWYAGYVESFKASHQAAKAGGRVEEANEAYVRYLLAGPGWASPR